MKKQKIHKSKQLEEFNVILDRLHKEQRELEGVFYAYFVAETKEPLENEDFDLCFEILDTWDDRNTAIHKFQLFNIIAKAEEKAKGLLRPRTYHERYRETNEQI